MSQEKLQTMSMQNFGGVKEVHYGIVQEMNPKFFYPHLFFHWVVHVLCGKNCCGNSFVIEARIEGVLSPNLRYIKGNIFLPQRCYVRKMYYSK